MIYEWKMFTSGRCTGWRICLLWFNMCLLNGVKCAHAHCTLHSQFRSKELMANWAKFRFFSRQLHKIAFELLLLCYNSHTYAGKKIELQHSKNHLHRQLSNNYFGEEILQARNENGDAFHVREARNQTISTFDRRTLLAEAHTKRWKEKVNGKQLPLSRRRTQCISYTLQHCAVFFICDFPNSSECFN